LLQFRLEAAKRQGGYNSFMADAERLMSGTSAGAFELKSLSNLVGEVTQKPPTGSN